MVPLNDISWSFKVSKSARYGEYNWNFHPLNLVLFLYTSIQLDPDWGNLYRAMAVLVDVAQELMPTGKEDIIEFIAVR